MSQVGDFLKDLRERKGLSINEVAEGTGIRTQYLEALENGEYSKIPGDVFIKGFIRNYANFLAVDGNALVEEYKNQVLNSDSGKADESINENVEKGFAFHDTDNEDDAEKKIHVSLWCKLKNFIYDNIYETIEVDDEDDRTLKSSVNLTQKNAQRQRMTHPSDAAAANRSCFFNGKVFIRVFVVCLVLFIGFMSYFLLSNIKVFPKSTNIFTAFRNAISTELTTDKAMKSKNSTIVDDMVKESSTVQAAKATEPIEDKKDEVITGTNYAGNGVVVDITFKNPVWTQVSIDGKGVEANTVAKGVTKTYKANKEVKVSLGSIRDVEIKVNGNVVPYGEKEWGTVEKTFKK